MKLSDAGQTEYNKDGLGIGAIGGWREKVRQQSLLTNSTLFFVSSTVVNAGNYFFNLLLGRWLGPVAFADVSLIITLFLFFTFITAGFQQTSAKFSAAYSAENNLAQVASLRRWLNRRSWWFGAFCFALVGGGATFWQNFFHTTSPWIFVIFAIGLPVYFVQGIDRGVLQGQTRFGPLAASYQAEMWVRLLVGFVLVGLGWSVNGAIWGLTLSIIATWLVANWALRNLPSEKVQPLPKSEQRAIQNFAWPVLMAETSLILINNSDVLIVKRFFEGADAGQYAALALIGRIVFFATWSVVLTMFPLVAQKQQRKEPHRHLLFSGLGMVAVVSTAIVGGSALMPEWIVRILFGAEYLPVAPLLWLYSLATALFALANVIINYRLALGNRGGTIFALIAGIAQVVALLFLHATLLQVVVVQVVIMAILFATLALWELRGERA